MGLSMVEFRAGGVEEADTADRTVSISQHTVMTAAARDSMLLGFLGCFVAKIFFSFLF
jgi:hypothetical protein